MPGLGYQIASHWCSIGLKLWESLLVKISEYHPSLWFGGWGLLCSLLDILQSFLSFRSETCRCWSEKSSQRIVLSIWAPPGLEVFLSWGILGSFLHTSWWAGELGLHSGPHWSWLTHGRSRGWPWARWFVDGAARWRRFGSGRWVGRRAEAGCSHGIRAHLWPCLLDHLSSASQDAGLGLWTSRTSPRFGCNSTIPNSSFSHQW